MSAVKSVPPQAGRTNWREVARLLGDSPGEWFLVAEDISTGVRSRLQRVYGFEIRMEGVDEGTHRAAKVYARYPEAESGAAQLTSHDARIRTKHLVTQLIANDKIHPGELAEAYRTIRAEIVKGNAS